MSATKQRKLTLSGNRGTRAAIQCHGLLALALITRNFQAFAAPTEAVRQFQHDIKPLLVQYCYDCHGDGASKGKLAFDGFKSDDQLLANSNLWLKVLKNVEGGAMPPGKNPHPSKPEVQRLGDWITQDVFKIDPQNPDPGRVTARRLNRAEYNNTVRDLLGVDFQPADDFPQDDSGYGFDSIGDVLSVSPVLMEKYLKAAEKVARTAVYGVEPLKPSSFTHQPWYVDFSTNKDVRTSYDLTGMSLPGAVHVMHRFPVDGEYQLRGWVRGFRPDGSEPVELGFWIDGKLIREMKVPVPAGGELNGLSAEFRTNFTAGEHWMSVTILRMYEGLPPAYKGLNPAPDHSAIAASAAGGGAVNADTNAPTNVEILLTTAATNAANAGRPSGRGAGGASRSPSDAYLANNLEVTGPFSQTKGPSAESLRKIYTCDRRDPKFTEKIITDLATRAFRRPATKQEIASLTGLVAMVQKSGDSFEEGLCVAIQKILISPNFLFRIESDAASANAKGARPVTPHELASRLSYFLWSSMPDEELTRCANDGSLRQPRVLEAQVRRMLQDPKSSALVENFGGQWLQFRALESHLPDRKKFQEFTEYTRLSLAKETELFFDYIMRKDRSVMDFVDADYTFLNQRLAEFYGIPDVTGHEWRKVSLEGTPRGGVLTQGSVLAVSSYATRTSPVLRGKWILENLLNAAPPPPPPDIPQLDDKNIGASATMRQQLEAHRNNATCASCHARMDPLGFGLENFDAIGAWRDKDGKFDVDATGTLPDGKTFSGPVELRAILKSDPDAIASAITEKMLTYALGRGLELYDRPAVRTITTRMAAEDYRFASLVLGIVNSRPFQMRRGN
jgi:cytochrome c553